MAFMPWRAARAAMVAARAAEKRGGIAHIEPVGIEPGSLNSRERLLQIGELGLGGAAVGFVGGEEVGHDAFKLERRAGRKARRGAGRGLQDSHPGGSCRCRFRDGQASELARRPADARGGFKIVQLRWLPDDGREPVLDYRGALAGKDAADAP